MCSEGFIYPCGDWYIGCWCVLLCVLMTCCKSVKVGIVVLILEHVVVVVVMEDEW